MEEKRKMAKIYDIISMGSAVIDAFLDLGVEEKDGMISFPVGTKVKINGLNFSIGGGGTNSSTCFSMMGLKAGLIAKIGKGYNGQKILNELKKNKIDFLGIQENGRTGYSAILESTQRNRTILTFKGANDNIKFSEINLDKLKTRWLYFTSMADESFKSQVKIAEYAKKNGIKIAFNPSSYQTKKGVELLMPILKNIEFLCLNKEEARMLVKEGSMFKGLKKLGPEIICITDGEKEGAVYDGKYLYKYWPKKVKVVEPTGAGDAFGSSMVAGLMRLNDIEEALKVAMTNAASLIQQKGAHTGLLHWNEIIKKIKKEKFKIEKIEFN